MIISSGELPKRCGMRDGESNVEPGRAGKLHGANLKCRPCGHIPRCGLLPVDGYLNVSPSPIDSQRSEADIHLQELRRRRRKRYRQSSFFTIAPRAPVFRERPAPGKIRAPFRRIEKNSIAEVQAGVTVSRTNDVHPSGGCRMRSLKPSRLECAPSELSFSPRTSDLR